jgi:hypothetical protein
MRSGDALAQTTPPIGPLTSIRCWVGKRRQRKTMNVGDSDARQPWLTYRTANRVWCQN